MGTDKKYYARELAGIGLIGILFTDMMRMLGNDQ